ncbi:MAG: disulfide bond formation protein B [Pseudomonadota bacterium]
MQSLWGSARLLFAALFLACAALLGYGLYLEFGRGLVPCPLCLLQRACYGLIALVALPAMIHGPRRIWRWFYGLPAIVFAATGAAIAARQVWLQHLPPDKVPECGPDLYFMQEMVGWHEALGWALKGTGECAKVDWTFLTLSIAEWSLLWFISIVIMLAAWLWYSRPSRAYGGAPA